MSIEAANRTEEQPDDLTASQILKRVSEVYANCATYEDAGVVEAMFVNEIKRQFVRTTFITAFERPARFRAECLRDKERCIVIINGARIEKTWNLLRWPSESSLCNWLFYFITFPIVLCMELVVRLSNLFPGKPKWNLALMTVNGITSGCIEMVSALLLPEEFHRQRMTEILEATRLEDRVLDDIACYCVQGKIWPYTILLWIDCATFLIKRVDEQGKYANKHVEKTITYYSLVNHPIEPQKFEFKPFRK